MTTLLELGNPVGFMLRGTAENRVGSAAGTEDSIRAFAAHSVSGPVHFGPVLTSAEQRGQGIGTVLLKRWLQDWQQAGVSQCEIVWAGPLSFYARTLGAAIGRAFWALYKSLG